VITGFHHKVDEIWDVMQHMVVEQRMVVILPPYAA